MKSSVFIKCHYKRIIKIRDLKKIDGIFYGKKEINKNELFQQDSSPLHNNFDSSYCVEKKNLSRRKSIEASHLVATLFKALPDNILT